MSDVVDLDVPVSADLLVLARLTAAAVASRAGFNVEEIDDLRLAVDELCLPLVRAAPAGRLHLCYRLGEDAIEITCSVTGDGAGRLTGGPSITFGQPHPDDTLSARILDALVDEHGHATVGEGSRHWLRKRRAVSMT